MNQFEHLFDISGLSIDRLRSFLKVAEAGNLATAAQGDVVRQSQYSRQIKELEGFFGSQGSVIERMLVPRFSEMSRVLGHTIIEAEQMRTMDVVRAVADGRIDFGIVREDALPPEMKRQRIGSVGYAVFAANALWKDCSFGESRGFSSANLIRSKVRARFKTPSGHVIACSRCNGSGTILPTCSTCGGRGGY